jgi:hypothetical protein
MRGAGSGKRAGSLAKGDSSGGEGNRAEWGQNWAKFSKELHKIDRECESDDERGSKAH